MRAREWLTVAGVGLLALACSSSKPHASGAGGADGGAGKGDASDAAGGAGTQGAAGAGGAGMGGAGGTAGAGGAAGTLGGAGAGGAAGGAGAGGGAGSGAAGSAGAGGMAGGAAGSGVVVIGDSVLTRNGRETREGFFLQPKLTKLMVTKMAPDAGFHATFTGSMYSSPLFVENGPQAKGVFIAATTNNMVYALDETTGAIVWMHSIGSAPVASGSGCGTVAPVGITSTPVIDAAARTIYVAGGIGTNVIDRHEIHALSLDDGNERTGWPVNVSALKDQNGGAFNTVAQNQRSALSLVNGILYVAYGGHGGDCNVYHGWVVAVDTKDPTKTGAWATGGVGEAIWASGGMASDGNGVFAVTGNRLPDSATHQDSEEVVHITGMGQLDRTTGVYFPATWRTMDQQDQDFGSSSPVLITVPGATPSKVLAAVSKDGHLYLMNPANLGGMGGHLQDLVVSAGGPLLGTLASYTSPAGVHVLVNTYSGSSCSTGPSLLSVLVSPGSPPVAKQAWCLASGNYQSAIATSTDGTNDAVVWIMGAGYISAIDGDSTQLLYNGANGPCLGTVRKWTSPIAAKGRVIVGVDNMLCSWSPH